MFRPRTQYLPSNPIGYLFQREYKDSVHLCKKILSERLRVAVHLYSKNLLAHYGCVNAIEFSNGGELLASGGDDRRVLLWNVEEAINEIGQPQAMRAQHISNIFCLGYDSKNTKIFSAGNDDQVIVHDTQTGGPIDYFLHEQPVYSLSIDPCNDNVFASACDDGRILIYDIRQPSSSDAFILASSGSAYHGVMFNPVESRVIATANAKDGAGLWDVRKPRQVLLKYGEVDSCMSVRWDKRGHHLLALRRRLPPVLYAIDSGDYLAQFDHSGYYNSCTMKSCCFAGEEDQYVLSGSDDFNLYMWEIPENKPGSWVSSARMILKGHRSIVNQVRFNPTNHLIVSSGVEKLIKVWSPFPLPRSNGEVTLARNHRRVFSHQEYVNLVLTSGQLISHDYSHQCTKEDPRMMAFFDSLVQREIEGWSSEESRSESHSASPINTDHVLSDSPLSSSPGNNEDTNCESAKPNHRNQIVRLIARKRAQLAKLTNNSHVNGGSKTLVEGNGNGSETKSDSDDSGTENIRPKKYTLRSKKRARSCDKSSSSDEDEKQHSTPMLKKRKQTFDWNERYSLENEITRSETPTIKEPSTSSETPDSGIALSEKPSSSKSKPRSKRNYRKRVIDSDSD